MTELAFYDRVLSSFLIPHRAAPLEIWTGRTMAQQIAKLIGGAGTGKTTELMKILGEVIATGVDPYEIGFVSFTRAAREEAANRVESEFGVSAKNLQRLGWFRTLHSICYQSLGGSRRCNLLSDNVESQTWIQEAVQEDVVGSVSVSEHDLPEMGSDTKERSPASVALGIWAVARNKLISLYEAYYFFSQNGGFGVIDFDHVRTVVERYERAKYQQDRMDFADLAGHAVGWRWNVDDDPTPCQARGEAPDLPVWIFDEHQDSSQLLHSVAMWLIDRPTCRWAYFAGDPFQSIYGFSGADHRCLLEGVEADKTRMMDRSYRCPAGVLELGESVLRRCSDYFDRKIKPNSEDYGVDATHQFQSMLGEVDPLIGSWLFLARTNILAKRFYKSLEREGIPWDYTRGSGGYCSPTVRKTAAAMLDLQNNDAIEPDAFKSILKAVPAGAGENKLLERGVKTAVGAGKHPLPNESLTIEFMNQFGCTPKLQQMIAGGDWQSLVKRSDLFVRADRRFGRDAAMNPKVRVGTIHSVKGSEADNVVMLKSLSRMCELGRHNQEGYNAEQRVAYVGVTRASKRLVVLSQRKDRWRMDL